MSRRTWPFLAAIVMIGGAAAASAQPRGYESAEENVRQSQAYERLLCTNPAFRQRRIAQECGPITDPQLHQQCVASFRCGGGASGSQWRQAPPSERIR